MYRYLLPLIFSALIVHADFIKIDSPLSRLDAFKYETPQGRQMKIPKKSKLIIVAFEKDTGALVNEYLSSKSPFYLLKHRCIFIADINKMPSIITNMFALPKLKKYKHLIYLHYSDKLQKVVPNTEKMITLLRVEESKIKEISYISTKKELKAVIEK